MAHRGLLLYGFGFRGHTATLSAARRGHGSPPAPVGLHPAPMLSAASTPAAGHSLQVAALVAREAASWAPSESGRTAAAAL